MAIMHDRLKELRNRKGMTLAQIADALGTTEATAQRYESGKGIKSIPYDVIEKYANIFGCKPQFIMGWEEEIQNDPVGMAERHFEMIMDEDSWYVVRHTAGVTKFVGSAKKPIPAKESEIKKIIHRSTAQVQKVEMDIKVGEKVRITSGPFAEFVGDITEVYPDKAKLRAMVSIFGRETPVELEYKQIQKL